MKNKNIFITGATGFIGKHLMNDLTIKGFTVYALTRSGNLNSSSHIKYITGDIFELNKHHELLSQMKYFIHIAGEKKDEIKMQAVNVDGMSSILSVIADLPHLRFLYVSSGGVYGIEQQPLNQINETNSCFPNTLYEKTKYEAEGVLKKISEKINIKFTIIRPTNVFGEFDAGFKLLNLFKAIKNNKFFFLRKDSIVNYVYVKQVTDTIVKIVDEDVFYNQIYNVNSACQIHEFVNYITNALNIEPNIKVIPSYFRLFIRLTAVLSDYLPIKYQFINTGKYRELTSEKQYSSRKINSIVHLNEKEYLQSGINNLVKYYQSLNKL